MKTTTDEVRGESIITVRIYLYFLIVSAVLLACSCSCSSKSGSSEPPNSTGTTDDDGSSGSDSDTDSNSDSHSDGCPGDPLKTEPGDCGCGVPEGTCSGSTVLPSDTVLVPPDSHGPIMAPITGYSWTSNKTWPDLNYELPIYDTLNRDDEEYWNYLVDELLLARVDVVMLHGRGCWDLESGEEGSGNCCPRTLSKFVAAVDRAGAGEVIRAGMWDDTGAYNKAYAHLEGLPNDTKLDLSDSDNWKYFWEHNIKIWFDTVPERLWFRLNGKPVIASWTLSDAFFSNQQGNASKLIEHIKTEFEKIHGVEPLFILQKNWIENDTTITTTHAVGEHDWFRPISDTKNSIYSYESYNGELWGAVAPSFRDGGTVPGCGGACREVTRRDGATLDDALQAGLEAKFILLEGWTDMSESAGFYRSREWRYPAQYINITRRYADPEPETLRFQAEGADRFSDTTTGNSGGKYRDEDLDIGDLDDKSGWFVGWTQADEWLEYQEVELGCGTYRFTARVATNSDSQKVRLALEGLPSVTLPNTGGVDKYELVHLGEVKLAAGTYDLRLVFETDGVNLDWFFLKRANTSCE